MRRRMVTSARLRAGIKDGHLGRSGQQTAIKRVGGIMPDRDLRGQTTTGKDETVLQWDEVLTLRGKPLGATLGGKPVTTVGVEFKDNAFYVLAQFDDGKVILTEPHNLTRNKE